MLNYPLTQYMFCSPDEGAAAVLLCRAELASKYTANPIYLGPTRCARGCSARSRSTARGSRSSRPTARPCTPAGPRYEMAGIGPTDVDIAQLQDTDAGAEVIQMAENGLCADGEQEALVADGDTEISGRLPVNTDGGLLANGEPIGASGLRQVHELVHQLRGPRGTVKYRADPEWGHAISLREPRHGRGHHRQHLTRTHG